MSSFDHIWGCVTLEVCGSFWPDLLKHSCPVFCFFSFLLYFFSLFNFCLFFPSKRMVMTNIIKHCSTLFPIAFNNQPNFNSLVDSVHLQLILATPLPTNSFRDWVCSGLSGNDEFSTKTATWAAHRLDLIHKPVREYN